MNIVIVGLGVIGGSYAKALQKTSSSHTTESIYGLDTNEQTLAQATESGAIKQGYTDPNAILPQADLVILALPPALTCTFIQSTAHLYQPGAILLDNTGIKRSIIEQIEPYLPANVDCIYAHPMAGREKQGFAYSKAEVFDGANFLLIPTSRNTPAHLELVKSLAKRVGFGNIMVTTAQMHDQMIAYTSQLTHAISVALMNACEDPEQTAAFSGDSYRELTRIASINEDLWTELFLGNREQLIHEIEVFQAEFEQIKQALLDDDPQQLWDCFHSSRLKHAQFLTHKLNE